MRPADNPFETQRINRVHYRPQGWTWDELRERLRGLHYRAAIVGAYGSGKTRLLEELGMKLEEQGFPVALFRVSHDSSSCPKGLFRQLLFAHGAGHVILLDEADRLSTLSWLGLRILALRARGLIVTSHTYGMLPLLVECRPTVQLLDDILVELVGQERAEIRDAGRYLFHECRGNIREVLRALYNVYAEKEP